MSVGTRVISYSFIYHLLSKHGPLVDVHGLKHCPAVAAMCVTHVPMSLIGGSHT